jgi:ABC-type sugar transport system ATPase subunit
MRWQTPAAGLMAMAIATGAPVMAESSGTPDRAGGSEILYGVSWQDGLKLARLDPATFRPLGRRIPLRVALGRALVRDPQVFLMDEPLSNLDAKLRMQTRGEIKRLQGEIGTTTVYVTHDQVEAMTLGDRIAVMSDGALEQVGTPDELYDNPANRFVGSFIGSPAMSFFEAATQRDHDAVRLRGDGLELSMPGAPELPPEVVVGVRPEGARVWRAGDGLLGPLSGRVKYVEALGRETFVGVETGAAQLIVHHDGRAALQPGDRIEFGLVRADLRFFSADDGLALRSGNGAAPERA